MVCAKNCEKLSKFIEVTAKILSVPYFLDTCTVGHGLLVIMGRVNLIIGQLGQGHCWIIPREVEAKEIDCDVEM